MIKKSNTPHKKEKILAIKKGLADGKKFQAKIEKVHATPNEHEEKNSSKTYTRKYVDSIGKKILYHWPHTD